MGAIEYSYKLTHFKNRAMYDCAYKGAAFQYNFVRDMRFWLFCSNT